MDQITLELIKHSPEVVYEKIADICNSTEETSKWNHARNFRSTTKGRKTDRTNIKSFTNNSFIPKILAFFISKRSNLRLNTAIPISQAAYRKSRSITEHVFAIKLITQRSDHIYIYISVSNMSYIKSAQWLNRAIFIQE